MFTVIGTLSHEYGHIAAAKLNGYDTVLHYGAMSYYPKGYLENENYKALNKLSLEYKSTEYNNWPEAAKQKVEHYTKILSERYPYNESKSDILITIGGPLQTIVTGTIGLIILFIRRKSIYNIGLKIIDWLAVFLSLFWLREVFNIFTSISGELISPNGTWFGRDELGISQSLNLWDGTIPLILATIGFVFSLYVIFRILPKKIRPTFILSGFIGGISGFVLWMYIIGPKVLP